MAEPGATRALTPPSAMTLEQLRERFTRAAFATWQHIAAEAKWTDTGGYSRTMPGEPCLDEARHKELIVLEGDAFHAYIVRLREEPTEAQAEHIRKDHDQ